MNRTVRRVSDISLRLSMEYKFSKKLATLKPSAIREIFKSLSDPTIISFAAGNPSPESFPASELAEIAADIFANSSVAALQYSVTEGYTPLREAVRKRAKEKFNVGSANDRVLIVSGGQQGLELACKVLCNEWDTVVCEEPSFVGALNSFRSNGAVVRGVSLEYDGLNTEELENVLRSDKSVKILYVIPSFQNPAGICTSLEKRKKIYELACKYDVIILEDDPYGELRFEGENIPTIKSMDTEGRVIYCSSFSKILSAGMRVGYVIAPEAVVTKMVVAKQGEDVHTNIFFQMLAYRYMTEYDMDAHIENIRRIYKRKSELMLKCLDDGMPKEVKYTRPSGGLFIWATLPDTDDCSAFVKAAIEKKVAVVPGSAFLCDTEGRSPSFRLNYSTPSDEEIKEGIARLCECASEYINTNKQK